MRILYSGKRRVFCFMAMIAISKPKCAQTHDTPMLFHLLQEMKNNLFMMWGEQWEVGNVSSFISLHNTQVSRKLTV